MAISYLTGFEMGSLAGEGAVAGNAVAQTTRARNGGYAFKASGVASTAASNVFLRNSDGAGGGRAFWKSYAAWVWVDHTNVANNLYMLGGAFGSNADTTTAYTLRLLVQDGTLGRLIVTKSGAPVVTAPSISFAFGAWHFIEVDVGYNAGTGVRLYQDGTLMGSADSAVSVSPQTEFKVGVDALTTAATWNIYVDDVIIWDGSSGGFSTTHTDWRISNLLPTADNSVAGGWTDEGGGTTALFEGVNNVPPIGSTATTGDNRIKNATSTTTGTYAATLAAYNTISGLTATSQVVAVAPIADTARDITTGDPKPGALALSAQPDQTVTPGEQAFTYSFTGSGAGAVMGTHPTGWKVSQGPVTTAPTITAASSTPVIRVKKNLASTRVVNVDYLAAVVLWTPPVVTTPQGTGTGTYTWAGTGTGAKAPRATATGAYLWAGGTVTGTRTPKSQGAGAYLWAGSATGVQPVTPKVGTATGAYLWAGAATTGARTPKATGTGAYAWAGTATGKRAPKATGLGAYAWAGSATGKRTPKATTTGAYLWAGAAAGIAPVVGGKTGTAFGSTLWAGTATGKRAPRATSSGTYVWAGSATGTAPAVAVKAGNATGTYSWAGTAAGRKPTRGTASGSYTWSGSATGQRGTPKATAIGSYHWAGTATGKRSRTGTATGTYAYAGTAVAHTGHTGQTVGAYLYAGTATGTSALQRDIDPVPRQARFRWDGQAVLGDWDGRQPRLTWTGHPYTSWAAGQPRLTPTSRARFNKEETSAHIH